MFLISCDKDRFETHDPEGNPTTMTVAISFPQSATRSAISNPYGTEDESAINTVDVFIYHTASGNFVSHTQLTGSDFTYKDGTGNNLHESKAGAKILTTTGKKTVFAGINLPSAIVKSLDGEHVSALSNAVQQITKDDLIGSDRKNFAMFSVKGVEEVFHEDESLNKVTVECRRLVAKVTVEQASDMKVDGVAGKLANLMYAINGFNQKMFLLQGGAPFKDPNWSIGSYNPNDFVNYYYGENDYEAVATFVNSVTISSTPLYASENTSEGKTKKELTRATVRGQFIPKEFAVWDGSAKTLTFEDNPNYATGAYKSFFAVAAPILGGTYYFDTKAMADAFADDKNAEFGYDPDSKEYIEESFEYINGYCYWDIFLNRNTLTAANRWDVLRNDFYMCKIARISTPGRSGPELDAPGGGGGSENPNITPDYDTNISVDIQILDWNFTETDYDL